MECTKSSRLSWFRLNFGDLVFALILTRDFAIRLTKSLPELLSFLFLKDQLKLALAALWKSLLVEIFSIDMKGWRFCLIFSFWRSIALMSSTSPWQSRHAAIYLSAPPITSIYKNHNSHKKWARWSHTNWNFQIWSV